MQKASYVEGGPLMLMLPLYLHVNQKSDDDDDDDDDDDFACTSLNSASPTGSWCLFNVVLTSMERHDVSATLYKRHVLLGYIL